MIVDSLQYPTFLEHMIKHFIRILVEGEPYFIAEYHIFVSFEKHMAKDNFMKFYFCILSENSTSIVINVMHFLYDGSIGTILNINISFS